MAAFTMQSVPGTCRSVHVTAASAVHGAYPLLACAAPIHTNKCAVQDCAAVCVKAAWEQCQAGSISMHEAFRRSAVSRAMAAVLEEAINLKLFVNKWQFSLYLDTMDQKTL